LQRLALKAPAHRPEAVMPERLVRMIVEQQKKVLTAPPTMTVDEAARLMKKHNVGAMMVVEKTRLAGIFTERDGLFRVLAKNRDPHTTHLSAVMTRNPKTVSPDKPFGYALFMMYEGGFRHMPVVENGRPIGMVSSRDALGPDLQQFSEEMQKREHIGEILG
jgi:CBS domain-containing protein